MKFKLKVWSRNPISMQGFAIEVSTMHKKERKRTQSCIQCRCTYRMIHNAYHQAFVLCSITRMARLIITKVVAIVPFGVRVSRHRHKPAAAPCWGRFSCTNPANSCWQTRRYAQVIAVHAYLNLIQIRVFGIFSVDKRMSLNVGKKTTM